MTINVVIKSDSLKNHFDVYKKDGLLYICPKDDNFPYVGEQIQFKKDESVFYKTCEFFFCKRTDDMIKYNPITKIGLLFSFETEEEAFYFKLKYCY